MSVWNKLIVAVSLVALLACGLVSGFCIGGLTSILDLIGGGSSGGHGLEQLGNLFFGGLVGLLLAAGYLVYNLVRYTPKKDKDVARYKKILIYSIVFGLATVAFTWVKVNIFGGWGW